jgi:hypothetical protein
MNLPRLILFALVLLVCLLTPKAYSQQSASYAKDGNDLLARCQVLIDLADHKRTPSSDPARVIAEASNLSWCAGFMQGITNTNLLYESYLKSTNPLFCLPASGITNGQAARVVVKYLQDHPENLHREPMTVAAAALMNAFPCNR